MLLILLLVFLSVLIVVLFYLFQLFKDENFDKIPGPKGLPIIGNSLSFVNDPVELFFTLRFLASLYKDLFKVTLGPMRNCVLYNPEDIETLISGTKHNSKGFVYRFVSPWLKEGLLLSDGEKWHQRRKILTPAFHFNILRHFNSILTEKSKNLVKEIEKEVNNTKTDLTPLISDFTLESICETAMGRKLDGMSDFTKKYKAAIHKLGWYFLYRLQRVWIYPNIIFNLTPLGRKQNKGHDTTTAALQFMFMVLANNQDVQDKIVKEYTDVLGSLETDATMNDMPNLKYLDCCIKECLRIYPPVPFFSRRCHQTLKLKNYTIPAGTDVIVCVFEMHRRSDIFPEPTVYRPERFLTDQHKWHQFAYIPFSAGPRNCIGQKFAMLEIKLAVSTVLRRFRLLPITKTDDIIFQSDFVLRSKDPIYVKFENRF